MEKKDKSHSCTYDVKFYQKLPRMKTDFTSDSIEEYMKKTFCAVNAGVKFGMVGYLEHHVDFKEEFSFPSIPLVTRGSILMVHFRDGIQGENVKFYMDHILRHNYYFLNCLEPVDRNPFEISRVTTWLFRRSHI
jgi:hypothetical protein